MFFFTFLASISYRSPLCATRSDVSCYGRSSNPLLRHGGRQLFCFSRFFTFFYVLACLAYGRILCRFLPLQQPSFANLYNRRFFPLYCFCLVSAHFLSLRYIGLVALLFPPVFVVYYWIDCCVAVAQMFPPPPPQAFLLLISSYIC